MCRWLFFVAIAAVVSYAAAAGAGAGRLVCYVKDGRTDGFTDCTHLVYAGEARGEKLEAALKEYRKNNPRLKIILSVSEVDKDHRTLLKSKTIQGLELHDGHKSLNRSQLVENVEKARKIIVSSGGGPLFLSLPANPELLAKYYDLRSLVKKVDLMMVQTHDLGAVKKLTYHPSRLSGLWDMMNTDSVVDLVIGLGVPASKIVISLPATAKQFTLQNQTLSTPGSPTLEEHPKVIDQVELCRQLQKGRWTLERDQDLSAPYAFKETTWMAFEDSSSVDVKGKYARVRGLAGLALHDAGRDAETPCGPSLLTALAKVLNQQSRAPRAAVLRSLENEILSAPGHARVLDAMQVSPYRITQVVDSDGVIHSIREDTRTEFSCSRQGYFVHPRSCARFYRCVKFDQLSPDYTVFEFDCPAGLAFDSRYEVCVWPGSLPDSQACPGSSEIAPVPQTRFVCPEHEGYYADPENCRWFFACLDHGKAPLTAYEFRCPFGLGFDAEKLKCDWPWLVPACGNIGRYEAQVHGFSGAILTGATGFHGQTADAVNVAAHQSLVSGASLNNLVGIQNGLLSNDDALNSNFIASQELNNGYATGHASQGHQYHGGLGVVQATKYSDNPRYTSGSLILDDYRLPTKAEADIAAKHGNGLGHGIVYDNSNIGLGHDTSGYNGFSTSGFTSGAKIQYQGKNYADQSGQYIHDPTGDYAEPYKHDDAPPVPYIHHRQGYKQNNDYFDYGRYSQERYEDNSGQYHHDSSGSYVETGPLNSGSYIDYSGTYNDNSEKYKAGVYRAGGHIGNYNGQALNAANHQQQQEYSNGNVGNYVTDAKAYTGSSHTLTAGAVNVGLVGKTTLVDAGYTDQFNYKHADADKAFGVSHQTVHNAHAPIISQPAVAINHLGTDGNNLDGYSVFTTPSASGIPTTATPFVTTALPVTTSYKTLYVPEQPKTTIKQIFGYDQAPVTYAQPTIVAFRKNAPNVQLTDYNQGTSQQYQTSQSAKSETTGYVYSKPEIKFQDGITYSTPTPVIVSTFKPQGFSHSQQTLQEFENSRYEYSTPVPVTEEPFKKIVAYTTGPSISYAQPTVASYTPHAFSQQTIHKTENTGYHYNAPVETGYEYLKPAVSYEQPQIVEYTTAKPVISTYQPQVYSHQTLHKVDASQVNAYAENSGYNYKKPASGYEYAKPEVKFEENPKTYVQYSTPTPAVVATTYKPQIYTQQTFHKIETPTYVSTTSIPNVQFTYQQPAVSVYENPILKYAEKITPVAYVQPSHHSFSHQTTHQVHSKIHSPSLNAGYEYAKPAFSYEQPKTIVQYTTAQPAVVSTTYKPEVYSHQTYHKVDVGKVNTYPQQSGYNYEESAIKLGYNYEQPNLKFEETPKIVQYSTPAPVDSTYKPQVYSQQIIHKVKAPEYVIVSTTPAPKIEVNPVTLYENPFLKYTQEFIPVKSTAATFTQNYQPIVNQHEVNHVVSQPAKYEISAQQNLELSQGYSYNQPEIQRTVETLSSGKAYSDATQVSHQTYHQVQAEPTNYDSGKDLKFVSTTPATLAYEEHYSEYESPKIKTYKVPEYVPPKNEYQSYSELSTSTPIQHSSVIQQIQDNYDIQSGFAKQYETIPVQQVSFSTSHIEQPKKIESIHLSSLPGTKIITKYNQVNQFYQSPEIILENKAEEYLPPVVSTATPIVSSTYKPQTFSTVATTREYLPPSPKPQYTREYLPPQPEYKTQDYLQLKVENEYVHPSTTIRPVIKSTTAIPTSTYREPDYFPPKGEPGVVNFETFGYKSFNPYQEYTISSTNEPQRKQNFAQTATSNLLGFGTVGPDAGLVLTTYTTSVPIISSTYNPEVVEVSTSASAKRVGSKYKSTTQAYVEPTTAYKAPEYLPPKDESNDESFNGYVLKSAQIAYNPYEKNAQAVSTLAPPKRKQNIVIQNAKANLLGFGTVGFDAGLVYTKSAPVISSSEYSTPKIVTTTYAPTKQDIVKVSTVPTRRAKPMVAVVTKINDFNPLLVRKLGAVCSCQSPIVVLRGRRPNLQVQDFEDYSNDYDDERGDLADYQYERKSARIQVPTKTVTVTPVVRTTTFNPIIVPDDSFYQDYQENLNIEITPKNKQLYSESYASSTPVTVTSTKNVVRIRPRVKAVTVAPTYKTVLLNQEVTPNAIVKDSHDSAIDAQTFDRYGPGGLRSRHETLQGSVDCKRAGLFRHPKQCNKFYACRWDTTKQRFTLHVFNCPVQLSFDPSIGACNWPSQGPACQGDTLLTNAL